jgi:hypothetical protein
MHGDTRMVRAWAVGFGLLVLADGVWLSFVHAGVFSKWLLLVLQLSPVVSGFIVAYLAPRRKLLLGTSMAIPATVLVVLFNVSYEALGNAVDFSGAQGALILFTITLLYSGIACGLGSLVGGLISRRLVGDPNQV